MGNTPPVMGAVLSSIPLCSRQGQDTTGDNKPEERQDNQTTVLAQPQSVHQQSNTSETCLDNENHKDHEVTSQTEDPEDLQVEEEASHAVEEDEEVDDGNVEVSLDDSQTDEWSLDKEIEVDTKAEEQEEEGESVEESYRKTPPELDTAAAITNILSEIVGGESDDSRAVVGR